MFRINLEINYALLFKQEVDERIVLLLTVAFWCIYKVIITRNLTGKEKRDNLKFIFAREIEKRIDVKMKPGKKYVNLPKEIMKYM